MNCPKCQGLVIQDSISDEYTYEQMPCLRCTICGWIWDPVFEANRINQIKGILPIEISRKGRHNRAARHRTDKTIGNGKRRVGRLYQSTEAGVYDYKVNHPAIIKLLKAI